MGAFREQLKTVPSVLIPIGAAWLAYCWQRRVAFTKALFDVWQKVVVTVQDAIQYTHLPQHTQADFAKVMHTLSCRIDDIRGHSITSMSATSRCLIRPNGLF